MSEEDNHEDVEAPERCLMCDVEMEGETVSPGGPYKRRIVRYTCDVCGYSCLGRSERDISVENGEADEEY